MSDPVKVLLVGMGGYGTYYVKQLLAEHMQASPMIEFIAGVDPHFHLCSMCDELQEMDLPIYTHLEAALDCHQPELIVISTPIHTHLDLCRIALASGASVLLEKPLCATLEDAHEMHRIEKESLGFVAIGYQCRYSQATSEFLGDVKADVFGKLKSQKTLSLRPRPQSYYKRNPWAGVQQMESGVYVYDSPVMNASAHDLYFQLLLSGCYSDDEPVLEECYLSRAHDIQNFDTAAISYTCNDVKAMFITSHSVIGEERTQSLYTFTDAEVHISPQDGIVAMFHDGTKKAYGLINDVSNEMNGKLFTCVAALRGEEEPVCRIEDARMHISLIDQIQDREIINVDKRHVHIEDGNLWVDGLEERLTAWYRDCNIVGAVCP